MFGNLITNAMVDDLRKSLHIRISPFRPERLRRYYYELSWTEQLLYERNDKALVHVLSQGVPFVFDPQEYALAVVREEIILGSGIFGLFVPASRLIELGFGVTVGKLDAGYGENGEKIRFGVKNLKTCTNRFYWDTPLAHILFFDLRSQRTDPVLNDPFDMARINIRKMESIVESAKRTQAELDKPVPFEEFGKQN